jgi:hypothetical protein
MTPSANDHYSFHHSIATILELVVHSQVTFNSKPKPHTRPNHRDTSTGNVANALDDID